jgi:hypothetical protein
MEPTDQVEGVAVNSSDASYPLGESKPLPDDFVPSESDVICGRARENFHHRELSELEGVLSHCCKQLHVFHFLIRIPPADGNIMFRDLIERSVVPYLSARTKFEKSEAIAEVVDQIQAQSTGGFVRKDMVTGNSVWRVVSNTNENGGSSLSFI